MYSPCQRGRTTRNPRRSRRGAAPRCQQSSRCCHGVWSRRQLGCHGGWLSSLHGSLAGGCQNGGIFQRAIVILHSPPSALYSAGGSRYKRSPLAARIWIEAQQHLPPLLPLSRDYPRHPGRHGCIHHPPVPRKAAASAARHPQTHQMRHAASPPPSTRIMPALS